ncbi:hypothetical protein DMB38_12865 [Streptomyces sp. WAC 06738]|uniref:hypothetical protein n=1 Tax=Streptomyces sp. WAC 06738 TaxID=2203210 RepID=UPI000F6FC965|nr:hypothetical protein [Streptomyces sp. WAC 06738]AZM46586.1 hypothetical protein DMB38_12865 [Streptomyces sp. WAC 06738]
MPKPNTPPPSAPEPPFAPPAAWPPPPAAPAAEPSGPRFQLPSLRLGYNVLCAGLALFPLFGGYSLSSGWGMLLAECRAEAGVQPGWILATAALLVAGGLDRRRSAWWTRTATWAAGLGILHMAELFDAVTLLTGVTR